MPLQSQRELKPLLTAYYERLAARTKPIAWCTSVGPAEILRTFGYEVYFPENHGALIGSKRLGGELIPLANREGFSADICSYLTSDVGAFLAHRTPLAQYGLAEVPPPDVLVYNTSQCREVKEWFTWFGKQFDAPVIGIQSPRDVDELTPELLRYLENAWRRLVADLEEISGKKFDEDLFQEVLGRSVEATRLWHQFLDSNRAVPAKHTFLDHVFLMAPVVVLRGEEEACDFYRRLVEEVENMPDPEPEKLRFYWEGMPIWGKIRFLAEFFAARGVRVVASTYAHSWALEFDPSDPFASMVKAYAEIFISRSQRFKLEYLKRMAQDFKIDAFIFHDAKTCPYNTNTRFALPDELEEATGIPVTRIFGDLVDIRHFSEQEFAFRLEAFLERYD